MIIYLPYYMAWLADQSPSQKESVYWMAFIGTPKYLNDGQDKSAIFAMIVNISKKVQEA